MATEGKDITKAVPSKFTTQHGAGDIFEALSFFLGDPNSPEKLRDYSEHHAATFHFPDAFAGSNTKIREGLNNLILHSPQEWQTNVALPFVAIQGTTVEWDVSCARSRTPDPFAHPATQRASASWASNTKIQ